MTAVADSAAAAATGQRSARSKVPWVPVVSTVIGVGYALMALGYGLGDVRAPGPGAVPFVVGVLLVVVGAVVSAFAIRATRTSVGPARDASPEPDVDGELASRFSPVATLLVVGIICALVMWQSRIIGLLPASGLAAAVLAWVMRVRVVPAVITGAGFFAVCYLLFERWLQVPLPRGYF